MPLIRPHRTRAGWLALLLLATMARLATAQGHAAEAEQRFRDGKKLMSEQRYREACEAFETSNRLDPALATLMNLADCREKNAQLQSAWTAFLEAERQTRDDARRATLNKTAKARATKLESRLSYLTVSVARGSDIAGLTLTRNGVPFDEGLWNTAIPVNGGTYVIGGRAPGHQEWSTTVTVPDERGQISVDVPRFKQVDRLVAPAPREDASGDPAIRGAAARPGSAFTRRRKLGLATGVAGLLAVGGGVLLGTQANGFAQDAADRCPTVTGCARADEADALVERARTRALHANIAYGVGGAAVVAAAILWLAGAPEQAATRTAVAPVLTPASVGLDIAVRF